VLPVASTNSASINSAVLAKEMFTRPPIEDPARLAKLSVARRIQSASAKMATAPQAKIQTGDAWTQ